VQTFEHLLGHPDFFTVYRRLRNMALAVSKSYAALRKPFFSDIWHSFGFASSLF
jgi:hypothetical protein